MAARDGLAGWGAPLARSLAALLVVLACGHRQGQRLQASGTIEATTASIAAKHGGLLTAVLAREGEVVDSAQAVAQVDDADIRWQLAEAQAACDLARAQLDLAVNGPRPQELTQARAVLAQAAAQQQAARLDLDRLRVLVEQGSATRKQLEEAESRWETARAAADQAQAALALLEAGTRPEQVASARAQLAQAEANRGAVAQRLADCTVRAPFAGTVTHRLMEPGEMAVPGSAVLALTRLDPVRLRVYLTESEVGRVCLGQPVKVYIDGQPGRAHWGRVSFVAAEAEFTPKNVQTQADRAKLVFAVEVSLDNPEGWLKPGLPADAVFVSDERDAGL